MRTLQLVVQAASFAATCHLAQKRDNLPDPYINHPLRVAVAAEHYGLSQEAIAAAMLHDVVEDTSCTLTDLGDAGFPSRTVVLVRLLTKWWGKDADPQRVRDTYKPLYYAGICGDYEAAGIKSLDRADNMDDGRLTLPGQLKWAIKYLRKTQDELPQVVLACANAGIQGHFAASRAKFAAAIGEAESKRA